MRVNNEILIQAILIINLGKMSGLQIEYSKEVAKELSKIPIVLPGTPVELGHIIQFPYGNRGVWPFNRPSPRGSFEVVTSLQNLNVQPQIFDNDQSKDTYIFSSRKKVKTESGINTSGKLDPDIGIDGKLIVSFNAVGAVYFAAVGCKTSRITNLDQIQVDLSRHLNKLTWDRTFLVSSITLADRALIMQASTKTAFLEIAGDINGFKISEISELTASSKIVVSKFKDSSFIKPWSENVAVFFGLHRFTKRTFGYNSTNNEGKRMTTVEETEFTLKPVSALEII